MKFLWHLWLTTDWFVCCNHPYVCGMTLSSARLYNTIDHFRSSLSDKSATYHSHRSPGKSWSNVCQIIPICIYSMDTKSHYNRISRHVHSSSLLSTQKVQTNKSIHQGRGSLTERRIGSSCMHSSVMMDTISITAYGVDQNSVSPLHHRPSIGHWAGLLSTELDRQTDGQI